MQIDNCRSTKILSSVLFGCFVDASELRGRKSEGVDAERFTDTFANAVGMVWEGNQLTTPHKDPTYDVLILHTRTQKNHVRTKTDVEKSYEAPRGS